MNDDFVSVIIPAAGRGTRMGKSINKQYISLDKKAILTHTIIAFDKCPYIDEILIVVADNEEKLFKDKVLKEYRIKKPYKLVVGGSTRQESVYNAVKKVDERCTIISVHDGARPLISNKEIINTVLGAKKYGGCVLGVPVKDTVKKADSDGFVSATVERSTLYNIRTPQVFKADILKEAYKNAEEKGIIGTDDSYLVEENDIKVKIIKGSYNNIKITTPEDLIYAQEILSSRN